MTYNSRFGLLTEKEIIKLNIFCIKEIKRLDKTNIVITGEPYHSSTSRSIEHLKIYEKAGNDIHAIIFGEKYYSDNSYNHFANLIKLQKISSYITTFESDETKNDSFYSNKSFKKFLV